MFQQSSQIQGTGKSEIAGDYIHSPKWDLELGRKKKRCCYDLSPFSVV